MTFRRMLPFLILNILVSAVTVLGILFWWQSQNVEEQLAPEAQTVVNLIDPAATMTAEAVQALVVELGDEDAPDEAVAGEEEPSAERDDGMELYVIQAGDTLGRLSTLYGVPLEDILLVNGIDNPNILQVGQEILIPVNGIPTPTPTVTPTAVPDIPPTPIPTETFEQGEVIIEINEVVAPGVLNAESVSIVNLGSRPVSLEGWQLSDSEGRTFIFPAITLFGDGAGILLHTEAGQSTALDLYWGLNEAIWQAGDTLVLRDTNGTEQTSFTVGAAEAP